VLEKQNMEEKVCQSQQQCELERKVGSQQQCELERKVGS
jgi:hypothetical protein